MQEGMTALMWAAYKNNTDIIQLMVRVNAKFNVRAKCGRTALCFAVERNNVAAVAALVRAGSADPNLPVMVTKSTPLMLAARSNHAEIVTLLLEDSVVLVKLNQVNNNGETAVFWAASYGHVEIVTQLLIAGANPWMKNREGNDAYSITKSDEVEESINYNCLDLFRPKA
jgi:ankyrin repeat protein